jgi:hypothetical protein
MGPLSTFIEDLEKEELIGTSTIAYALEVDKETYKELVKETKNINYFGPYRLLISNEETSRIRFLYTRERLGDF